MPTQGCSVRTREGSETVRLEEHGLVRQAQKGDRNAFATLVDRYWDPLHRWLYRMSRDAHAAEDLTQETFLRAFAALPRYQETGSFQAWLYRIAHNLWANQRRTAGRLQQFLTLDLPTRGEGPESEAVDREALALLQRAVGRLPADFRAAFLLRAEEGLSFREIGDALDITEETARWRVFKARHQLMESLAPLLDRESS